MDYGMISGNRNPEIRFVYGKIEYIEYLHISLNIKYVLLYITWIDTY